MKGSKKLGCPVLRYVLGLLLIPVNPMDPADATTLGSPGSNVSGKLNHKGPNKVSHASRHVICKDEEV